MKRALWLAPLLVLFGACSGNGNTGRKEIAPALVADVPWVNGAPPLICGIPAPGQTPPADYTAACLGVTSTQAEVPKLPWCPSGFLDAASAQVPGAAACDPTNPTHVVYPPIGPGGVDTPDPGSRVRFDTPERQKQACAPLENLELSQWQLDFEPTDSAQTIGVAPFFSAYDDHTDSAWHIPGDAAWYEGDGGKRNAAVWGLAAQPVQGAPHCNVQVKHRKVHSSDTNESIETVAQPESKWAMHIRGGRFDWFGGGTEHVLNLDCGAGSPNAASGADPDKVEQVDICNHVVDAVGDGRVDQAVDVSAFDGLAFWARRGPDGITGLQVVLQDKYTSDRLERTSQTSTPGVGYCKRYKVCFGTETDSQGVERCTNGGRCVPVTLQNSIPPTLNRCVPDGVSADQLNATVGNTVEPALLQQLYPPCGKDECVPPSYDPDVDYNNTSCKPYNFTGLEERRFCFGDTPPPAADERCGDGFASNVSLSTDWTFYKLPFSSFKQVGFGKKAPPNDVPQKTLYTISFLFSVGNTDFYLDNVTFYREK